MLRNRNEITINKAVGKIIKFEKMRNIIAIIAITISTMLFTSLGILTEGIIKSQTLMMQMQAGTKADAEVKGMTKEQTLSFITESLIEKVGIRRPVTYLSNTKYYNIELNYLDENAQEMFFSKPVYGHAPEKENEIATSDKALEELGIEPQIGNKVCITFKLKGDEKEYKYNMILSGWWETSDEQQSIMLISNEFMDKNNDIFEKGHKNDFELGRYSAEIILKNRKNAEKQLKKLVKKIGGQTENQDADNFTSIVINRNNVADIKEILFPAIFILLLFILCSYLMIYNIFDIGVIKDIKTYGLLTTIGTTPSQIRKIVVRQALFLSIISIPLGLILGYITGLEFLPFAMSGIETAGYKNEPINNNFNAFFLVFGSVITLVSIFISTFRPARKASKFNVVDAVKFYEGNDKKYAGKRTKVYCISYSNFTRNKKRAVIIIASLSICIILFNSVFVVSKSLDTDKYVKAHIKTDYIATSANVFNLNKGFQHRSDGMSEDYVNFLKGLHGVKDMGYIYKNTKEDNNISFEFGKKMEAMEYYPNDEGILEKYGTISIDGNQYGVTLASDDRSKCNVYGIDNMIAKSFQYINSLNGMSRDEVINAFFSGDYVIEGALINVNNPTEIEPIPGFQCDVGQKIFAYKNGKLYKKYIVIAQIAVIQAEIEANNGINGAIRVGQDAPYFYFPYSEFTKMYDSPTLLSCSFNVKNDTFKMIIDSKLREFTSNNSSMGFYSSEQVTKEIKNEQRKLFIIGGFMAAILGIAGIINFINVVATMIISRRKEFAIMESIGMTYKQLNQMIVWEGIYYVLYTGLFGLISSFLMEEMIIKKILSKIWYYSYNLTLFPVFIIWLGMLIVLIFSSIVCLKIFNKGDLSDRLLITE